MTRMKLIVTLALACVFAISAVALAATINGTSADNFLVGTDQADSINGLAGNDTIIGQGGGDLIDGGPGNDLVLADSACQPGASDISYCERGGTGNDTVLGGDGN